MDPSSLTDGGACSRSGRLGAIIVAALLTGLAAGCLVWGRVPLAAHPGFLPAFGGVSLFVDGLVAGLLLVQARISARRSVLRLGAAYLFAALITVPHLLANPGMLADGPIGDGDASAFGFWCAWHGGFAMLVTRFALATEGSLRPGDVAREMGWAVSAAVCLGGAATLRLAWLPGMGLVPPVLVVTALAAWLVVVRLRFRTVLAVWLSVALLAAVLGVALTLLGDDRFTMGWYAARVESLMAGLCVLFALLWALMGESRRVLEANARLERMVRTDGLTGLCNRRAFELALASEWRRAQREQTPLSLLMIDIDSFKAFNDRYGHPAGDACLREVGRALAGQAYRPADIAARVGGEEFALILPATEETGAMQVAERLRASVAALLVTHAGSGTGYVTVSIGAATARPYGLADRMGQVVDDADSALYRAKAGGRNTVRGSPAPQSLVAPV